MVRPVIRVPYTSDVPGKDENAALKVSNGAVSAYYPSSAHGEGRSASCGRHHVMSKVPSLMFDMEDMEDVSANGSKIHQDLPAEGDVVQEIQSLSEPWDEGEFMLRLHVHIAAEEAAKRGLEHLAVPDLADTLRKLGYAVKIRTALGGGWGGACLRNLRHSFLAVTVAPTSSNTPGRMIIVDPRFREQFQIAHTTPRYERLLSAAPAEIVAPSDRLAQLVEIMCAEMATAFTETGTPLPPWRQTAAMLSKWQPRRSEEVDLSKGDILFTTTSNNAARVSSNHGELKRHHPSKGAFFGKPHLEEAAVSNGTVAQKLASMGFEPQSPPSTVAEEAEESESWTSAGDVDDNNEDISCVFHSDEDSSEATQGEESVASPPISPRNGPAQAVAAALIDMKRPMEAIWMDIKEAVVSTPQRRSTWG